jgi:hypothetical protein
MTHSNERTSGTPEGAPAQMVNHAPPVVEYYGAIKAEATALASLGLPLITVIAQELDAERWPAKSPGKDGKPKPAYTGKNPSHWLAADEPRLLSHTRPQTIEALHAAVDRAEALGQPIGLAVVPSTTVVVVDLDRKDFSSDQAMEAAYQGMLAAYPELAFTRTERTPGGGLHLYLKVADGMQSWRNPVGSGHYCQFTTDGSGDHHGEILHGRRVCVAAPTQNGRGPYTLLNQEHALSLVVVPNLAALGIRPTVVVKAEKAAAERAAKAAANSVKPGPGAKPRQSDGTQEPPQLEALLGRLSQQVLHGGQPFGDDRSSNLTGFAKEAYGWENWLKDKGLPFGGTADAVIRAAVVALEIEDKADRVLETIDRATCLVTITDDKAHKRYGYLTSEGRGRQSNQGPAQLPKQQEKPQPYRVLGWNAERSSVWYRHHQTAQIATAKPFGQQELLRLAPLDHWYDKHPKTNKKGDVVGIDWSQAASDLIQSADTCGIFEIEQVRGRGVWIDGGKVVWHLGDKLEVDGVVTPLADHKSDHHYGLMASLPIDLKVAPLDDDHGNQILQVLKDRGWQGPSDHLHLAGWIVLSSVGGALRKRPGLQITSPFGSGKSDTIERVIDPLQGGIGRTTTGSTEAGIRQLIGRDALPCTVDESEAEDGRKRDAQLRLVRYSYDGIPVVKGTPGGGPMTFCLRSALALAGINSPIDNPADRSRMAVISPKHLPADQWIEVSRRRDGLITVEAGQQLLRRTISNLPSLLANITTFGQLVSGQIASNEAGRAGDTFGALLAGSHHLTSTKELTRDEAQAWLDLVGWEISHADSDDTDRKAGSEGRQCLEYLLAHEVRWIDPGDRESGKPTTGNLSVRELVHLALNSPTSVDGQQARTALGRMGLHATQEGLIVARSSPATQLLYCQTKWIKGGHADRLLEIEGTIRTSGPTRFPSGGSHRAVMVPWAAVGPLGEQV